MPTRSQDVYLTSRLSIIYADTERPPLLAGSFQEMVTEDEVIWLTDSGPIGTDGVAEKVYVTENARNKNLETVYIRKGSSFS